MIAIPMEIGLLLAGLLFAIGVVGLLSRRNILFLVMSIEIMLNAAGLAFVVAGHTLCWIRAADCFWPRIRTAGISRNRRRIGRPLGGICDRRRR
jgi:hypothetical protein